MVYSEKPEAQEREGNEENGRRLPKLHSHVHLYSRMSLNILSFNFWINLS